MVNTIINFRNSVIAICFLLGCNNNENAVANSMPVEEPKEVSILESNNEDDLIRTGLNNFYKEYLNQIAKFPVNESKLKEIKTSYCTERLLHKLDTIELDYDPFTNSQDFDPNTANKLNITRKSDLSYTVSFSNNSEYTTTLFLIKKENKYYIDSILDLY
jgi:hypothetical protein